MSDSFRVIDRHLLSLNYSGIYFTFEELLSISKALELSLVATSKESLIRSLAEEATKSEKLEELRLELQKVALKRVDVYKRALEISSCTMLKKWILQAENFIKTLNRLEKRG